MPSNETKSATAQPAFPAHKPRIFWAILVCFAVLFATGYWGYQFRQLPLAVQVGVDFIPLLASMALLYPTGIFRKHRPPLRTGLLFLLSGGLLLGACVLVMIIIALLLLATGGVPE